MQEAYHLLFLTGGGVRYPVREYIILSRGTPNSLEVTWD